VTSTDWMRSLAAHVEAMRLRHPDDELVVAFDIDGTIVDTRHLVVHLLVGFDRAHGTEHFRGVTAGDVVAHETRVDEILDRLDVPRDARGAVAAWYRECLGDADAIAAAHRPYEGVLGVIRWFQLRPGMRVAINTGRPESMREATLRSLNALGSLHRVTFDDDLLFMNATGTPGDVAAAKVEALRSLRRAGYRVAAVVDNEPAMIRAMAEDDEGAEILFLHADTIFDSKREPTPRTVSGSEYGLSGLVDEAEVGRRVALVWHGVNDRHNLHHFVASDVRWAEIDVRRDPAGRLVLRHDSFTDTPWTRGEELLALHDCLEVLRWNCQIGRAHV